MCKIINISLLKCAWVSVFVCSLIEVIIVIVIVFEFKSENRMIMLYHCMLYYNGCNSYFYVISLYKYRAFNLLELS